MEWIKTNNRPSYEEVPKDSGNWDYCSKEVLVAYVPNNQINNKVRYAIGYTDYDDGEYSWTLIGKKETGTILAFSYIEEYKDK